MSNPISVRLRSPLSNEKLVMYTLAMKQNKSLSSTLGLLVEGYRRDINMTILFNAYLENKGFTISTVHNFLKGRSPFNETSVQFVPLLASIEFVDGLRSIQSTTFSNFLSALLHALLEDKGFSNAAVNFILNNWTDSSEFVIPLKYMTTNSVVTSEPVIGSETLKEKEEEINILRGTLKLLEAQLEGLTTSEKAMKDSYENLLAMKDREILMYKEMYERVVSMINTQNTSPLAKQVYISSEHPSYPVKEEIVNTQFTPVPNPIEVGNHTHIERPIHEAQRQPILADRGLVGEVNTDIQINQSQTQPILADKGPITNTAQPVHMVADTPLRKPLLADREQEEEKPTTKAMDLFNKTKNSVQRM